MVDAAQWNFFIAGVENNYTPKPEISVLTTVNHLPNAVCRTKVKVPLSKKTLAGRNGCTKRF
jgi:hypothetical protein